MTTPDTTPLGFQSTLNSIVSHRIVFYTANGSHHNLSL